MGFMSTVSTEKSKGPKCCVMAGDNGVSQELYGDKSCQHDQGFVSAWGDTRAPRCLGSFISGPVLNRLVQGDMTLTS